MDHKAFSMKTTPSWIVILFVLTGTLLCEDQGRPQSDHSKQPDKLLTRNYANTSRKKVKPAFEAILQQGLNTYFTEYLGGRIVHVQYALLRNGLTQSGIAYPKIYLWVKILDHKDLIDEGAVRVAVIAQSKIQVTHYLPRGYIRLYPKQIGLFFPAEVAKKIVSEHLR
jgi:hypothetical protein